MLSVGVSKSQPVPSLPLPHAPVPQPGKINNYKRFSALQPYTRLSSLQSLARDVWCVRGERGRGVVLLYCISVSCSISSCRTLQSVLRAGGAGGCSKSGATARQSRHSHHLHYGAYLSTTHHTPHHITPTTVSQCTKYK